MSLLGFQRALADLTALPDLCAQAIVDPDHVLLPYDLTAREHDRLSAMVRDPLMATNCTLYRVNRVTPIYMYFPMTCHLLGPDFRRELDAFWQAHRGTDLQYIPETNRFARFIQHRVKTGVLTNEFIEEIVSYEAVMMELRFTKRAPDSPTRCVLFSHEPGRLLEALSMAKSIPADLARGMHWVEVSTIHGELEVRVLSSGEGTHLIASHVNA